MPIAPQFQALKVRWSQRHRTHESHLSALFEQASPHMSVESKTKLLQSIFSWLREPLSHSQKTYPQLLRLKFLLQILEKNPIWKNNLSQILQDLLLQSDLSHFLANSGLPQKSSLLSEIINRISRRMLPQATDSSQMGDLISLFFITEHEPHWLLSIDQIHWTEIMRIVAPDPHSSITLKKHWHKSIKVSLVYLSSQMENLVFLPELHRRTGHNNITQSAFWHLRFLINKWFELNGNFDSTPEQELTAFEAIKTNLISCRNEINSIIQNLDDQGLSLKIIFEIDLVERYLSRFEYNLNLIDNKTSWLSALTELMTQHLKGTQLQPLFQNNFYLLSRSLVERFSVSGEHYITRNTKEYRDMFKSAAGGGALTAITTLIKLIITKAQAPLFIEGLFHGINYAGSFLTISLFHFTLATKQPAMTAPALSLKLKNIKQRDQIQSFIDEVANLIRSQFIAAIGNVGLVIPVALIKIGRAHV